MDSILDAHWICQTKNPDISKKPSIGGLHLPSVTKTGLFFPAQERENILGGNSRKSPAMNGIHACVTKLPQIQPVDFLFKKRAGRAPTSKNRCKSPDYGERSHFYTIPYRVKSAPYALALPKRFTLRSVSVPAARFFARFPISQKRTAAFPTTGKGPFFSLSYDAVSLTT
ncbi:MAG: hypothetical protein Q4F18_04085, partial [Clostridia bacterium]|nr:hypothetical protein [Clostridia bacterium]